MAPVEAALQELLRNDTERSTLALSTVQKIVNNILSHQDDPKYRRLRTENKAIKEKVMSAVGGGALLEALGFAAQGGDELVLPMEASPVTLLQARMKIDTALTQMTSPPSPAPPAPAAAPAAAPVASAPPAAASPAEDAMEVDAPADEVRPAEDEAMADGDNDLAAALALSATNNGLRHPPPTPATAPAAAPAGAPGGAQEALAQRVRQTHPNAHPSPRPSPSPNLNPDPDPRAHPLKALLESWGSFKRA